MGSYSLNLLTTVITILANVYITAGGLPLVKQCGDITCKPYAYCHPDLICHNCSVICNSNGHNSDLTTCEEKCQDYIHDVIKHYLTEDSLTTTKTLQETIECLRTLVAVSITISCIVALALLALIGFLWLKNKKRKQRRMLENKIIDKKLSSVSVIYNNNDDGSKERSLKLEMPPPPTIPTNITTSAINNATTTIAPSVATTTTPISTRHPSEDTTLEDKFIGYDNPNLTPSPILNQNNRHETIF